MKNINGKGFWVIWVHIATGYILKMGDATQNISMKVLFVPQYVKMNNGGRVNLISFKGGRIQLIFTCSLPGIPPVFILAKTTSMWSAWYHN